MAKKRTFKAKSRGNVNKSFVTTWKGRTKAKNGRQNSVALQVKKGESRKITFYNTPSDGGRSALVQNRKVYHYKKSDKLWDWKKMMRKFAV